MSKKKTETQTIVWKETVTIENSQEKTQELLNAFNTSKEIALDMSELENIDVTGVQLIIAAQKEAIRKKTVFKIIGTIPPAIASYFTCIGIPVDTIRDGEQFSSNILNPISAGDNNA